jgi:hypothetical protein
MTGTMAHDHPGLAGEQRYFLPIERLAIDTTD